MTYGIRIAIVRLSSSPSPIGGPTAVPIPSHPSPHNDDNDDERTIALLLDRTNEQTNPPMG